MGGSRERAIPGREHGVVTAARQERACQVHGVVGRKRFPIGEIGGQPDDVVRHPVDRHGTPAVVELRSSGPPPSGKRRTTLSTGLGNSRVCLASACAARTRASADWISGLARIARCPDLRWAANSSRDWLQPFPGWPGTRYEAKAIATGRRPTYLEFVRNPR